MTKTKNQKNKKYNEPIEILDNLVYRLNNNDGTFTGIDFSHEKLGNKCKNLADTLFYNDKLKNIDIKNNFISKDEISHLANALYFNKTLESLNLRNNTIGDDGVILLTKALIQNSTLTSIDIAKNSIGDKGSIELANLLLQNSSLIYIDLSSNSIGKGGAIAFSYSMRFNDVLEFLYLSRNNIDLKEQKLILKSLYVNVTLKKLDVDNYLIKQQIDRMTSWNTVGAIPSCQEIKKFPPCCQDRILFILLVLHKIPTLKSLLWNIVEMIKVQDIVKYGYPFNKNTWV